MNINKEYIHDIQYRKFCEMADKLLAIYNPCKIENNNCIRGSFCCNECNYLINNKCSINSLVCKLWLCEEASKSNKLKEKIFHLFKEIQKYEIENNINLLVVRGENIVVNYCCDIHFEFGDYILPFDIKSDRSF